ncbi:unnamed protein product [Phaeothamnion confervicola]
MTAVTAAKITIVRKSFDGRWRKGGEPKFSYTVDVTLTPEDAKKLRLSPRPARIEPAPPSEGGATARVNASAATAATAAATAGNRNAAAYSATGEGDGSAGSLPAGPRIVVLGCGPAGLFAALTLARAGLRPIIVERGRPVETRGRDIGALFARKILNPDSNLCYGEGGAGTWSDGKLTTRIGRNSGPVREVLETLVAYGAPERILVDGKPHLGTDRLVRILRSMREGLAAAGATFMFNTRVEDFAVRSGKASAAVTGLKLAGGTTLPADAVVLAVGHSSRQLYARLEAAGAAMAAKPIAVGFRVEHPQRLIDQTQFGPYADMVERGAGKVPVADYRLATQVHTTAVRMLRLPFLLQAEGGRGCYSFCMCPGGQVVPTSVDPNEVCVNGMSFSRRGSKWANAALVVTVEPEDMAGVVGAAGADADSPLRGVEWQRVMEREAARRGGGDLVVPVQRVTDFLERRSSAGKELPTSSYRLGVRGAALHDLYPVFVGDALAAALADFEAAMPGFVTDAALLHGVETRTSAPVQVTRDKDTLECVTLAGLYPAGEGAGYAGGIVSAAVDGIRVGTALAAAVVAR